MSEFEWTLIDTETIGLVAPIYILVELAGLMAPTAAPTSPSSMMRLLASDIYKADVYDN